MTAIATARRQLALPLVPALPARAPDFFAAASNQEALAWLERPAAWPDGRLLLWGPPGVGKSHLLHRLSERAGGAVLPGGALRWPAPAAAFLAVDDADAAPERPLLHLLNEAAAQGRRVLLAARSPAPAWPVRLADLASRLRAVTACGIAAPEDDVLRAILRRLCADRQLCVPEALQDWLLLHLPRTGAALAEAAARLDRAALACGGRVTRGLAAQIVDEMAAMWHADAS